MSWPRETPVSCSDVTDGVSNTWLLVELADSGINWTEPRDLHVLQMAPQINPPTGQGICSKHSAGANIACVDGSVRFVPELLAPQEVRAMITIDGGEKISQNW